MTNNLFSGFYNDEKFLRIVDSVHWSRKMSWQETNNFWIFVKRYISQWISVEFISIHYIKSFSNEYDHTDLLLLSAHYLVKHKKWIFRKKKSIGLTIIQRIHAAIKSAMYCKYVSWSKKITNWLLNRNNFVGPIIAEDRSYLYASILFNVFTS